MQHSIKLITVSCLEPEYSTDETYVMQVYDADNRHLLGSTTSLVADLLQIADLPREQSGHLLISIRSVTSRATSEATTLYSAPMTSHKSEGKP